MPTQKIDPKVIFASDAPAIDKPPVFSDKTKGWDVARANDGRPEIKQMNKMQQDTDLKILWLNENAVLPYDGTIDYPDGVVTLKDGSFKQLSSGLWVEFLDDFADKDAVKRGIANRYDSSLVYNSGERVVLANGDIVKSTIDGNTNDPNADMTDWLNMDFIQKSRDECVNIFEFCKCDGVDESEKALLAVNRANSRRIPLYIPPNAELLISGTTTLEPMYGLFGGGRIRRLKTGWGTGFATVLLNQKRAYCDGITFLKHDVPYDDLDNVTLTEKSPVCGWIEVTKNADAFTITNNKFRGALFNIFQYGGSGGLIHKNDSDITEQAFLNVGLATYYTRPTENVGNISSLVISMNRVRNVSNAPIGGVTGDGVKLMANVQNTVIIGNDIQHCKGDAIDLFASGQDVIIKGNILGYSGVKNIDIKARYVEYPADVWGRNQQIIVDGNHIFSAETDGVSVSNTDGNPPMISIINNNIYDNRFSGIWWRGKQGNINGNTVYNNAKSGRAYDCGIKIEGNPSNPSGDLNVNHNICFNNGFGGTPEIANNCGIVFFNTVNNCNAHHNICFDSADGGLPNSGTQNFGIYVQVGCKNISLLHNIARGNLTRQIGWATGAGIIGEKRTLHIGSISDSTKIPFAGFESEYGIVSARVQASPFAADAVNYYSFSVDRIADTGGSVKIRDIFNTASRATSLFGTEISLPQDVYEARHAPLFAIVKTGTPVAISAATVSLNFVTW